LWAVRFATIYYGFPCKGGTEMGTHEADKKRLEDADFKFKVWQTDYSPRWHVRIEGRTFDGDSPIVVEFADDDFSKAEKRAVASAIEKYDASSRETVRDRNRQRKERNAKADASGDDIMSDIIEILGPCNGKPCQRESPVITSEQDRVSIGGKDYHKGCQPKPEEQEGGNRSYT